jgi:hypothetical protein
MLRCSLRCAWRQDAIADRMVDRSSPTLCGVRALRPCTIDATRYAARACVRCVRDPRQWWRHLSTPTAPLARSPTYTVTPHSHTHPFTITHGTTNAGCAVSLDPLLEGWRWHCASVCSAYRVRSVGRPPPSGSRPAMRHPSHRIRLSTKSLWQVLVRPGGVPEQRSTGGWVYDRPPERAISCVTFGVPFGQRSVVTLLNRAALANRA